jgi:hypothetical protein
MKNEPIYIFNLLVWAENEDKNYFINLSHGCLYSDRVSVMGGYLRHAEPLFWSVHCHNYFLQGGQTNNLFH